jgi:hypothetical protein
LVGFFVTAPLAMIAATYAYEDIFGAAGATAAAAGAGGLGPTGTVVMPGAPPKQPTPAGAPWKPQNPGYAIAAVSLGLGVILIISAIERHRNNLRGAEREDAIRAAEVNRNAAFDAFLQRVKSELNFQKKRFHGMHVVEPRDNTLMVSFSGLEESAMVNGTNAAQNIAGTLVAEPDEHGNWNFQGQEDLRTINFIIPIPDKEALLQESRDRDEAGLTEVDHASAGTLGERLEAASAISDQSSKNGALAAVAKDAAKAGEVAIVESSLRKITDTSERDNAALESVAALAKSGQRKQAIEIAKMILSADIRDRALSDLAQ